MTTKVCSKCGEEKDINEFTNNHSRKDGKLERCKACMKVVQKEEREKNKLNNINNPQKVPDKLYCSCCKQMLSGNLFNHDITRKNGFCNRCINCMAIYGKKRYENNKDIIKEKSKKYRLDHLEEIKIKSKIARDKNKKPLKLRSEYNYNHTQYQRDIIAECNRNRIWKEETKIKLSQMRRGIKQSPEARKKMGESRRGERNPRWKGGVSFGPYCIKFNKEFKERVRLFFNYNCVECGKSVSDNKNRQMAVHHVNYDKDTCCNKSKPLFVTLCMSCHSRTNTRGMEQYWESHFTDIINTKYGGECYIPKYT